MRTLARAVGSKDIGGEPLPTVFRTFDVNKIVIRRAEVSMIAGTPGAGKSTLALAIALRSKVPTLYISADTNAHTMAMRLLSMISGQTQSVAEQMLIENVDESRKVIKALETKLAQIQKDKANQKVNEEKFSKATEKWNKEVAKLALPNDPEYPIASLATDIHCRP